MNMNYTAEELAFRDEVRAFLDEKLPADIADKVKGFRKMSKEDHQRWQKILTAQGWYATHWPEEYGGVKWSPVQKHIWDEESCAYGVPRTIPFGVNMVAPVIIKFGTEEQKQHYLPKILSGEHWWCQGYSEPGAGSDLASLKTFAEKDGDDYILNGTKIWTTYAHYANKMFALVRTNRDGKPQQGITFLLLDMDLPGITIEPIVGLDEVPEQCQVFFDNVRVPQKNRVGEENDGWTVAKYLLTFERGGQEYAPGLNVMLEKIRLMAGKQQTAFGPLTKDLVWQHKFAALEADVLALEFTEMRIKSALSAGKDPGALSSMTKILGTELLQKVTELRIETLGSQSVIWQPQALVPGEEQPVIGPEYALTAMPHYLNSRACSIYGGSNEVQRGIIAKAVLGL